MRCPKKKEIKGGIIKEKRSWSEQRKITIGAGVLINSSPAGASDFAIFSVLSFRKCTGCTQ